VLIPQDEVPCNLQYHIFTGLSLYNLYLIQRSGVYSVLVSTLLNVLRKKLLVGNDLLPRGLSDVILGRTPAQNVEMATTRVPYFFDNMQDPLYGYQLLSPLSNVAVQPTMPPPYMDNRQELLSVQATDPKTMAYTEMWQPCRLNIDKHFILIFNLRSPTPSPSQTGSFQNDIFTVFA
jgi:hypothetical protein